MLDWKSSISELAITSQVSSVTKICVEFPIKISGKLFVQETSGVQKLIVAKHHVQSYTNLN